MWRAQREKIGLKIDSATVGMESARNYRSSTTTVRKFAIKEYQAAREGRQDALDATVTGEGENDRTQTDTQEKAENKSNSVLEQWQNRFSVTAPRFVVHSSADNTVTELRQLTVRYIFDLLFGARRGRQYSRMEDNSTGFKQTDLSGPVSEQNTVMPVQTFKSLFYMQESYYEEYEDTTFSTMGTVKTSDGREINFQVNVGMSRSFQEYFREDLEVASFAFCDPLVINLDVDSAQLSDQTFYFDIDADGVEDEVSNLGSGSGYLALDKNGDGEINDGSELFGTASGNGFADLARYDEDGNGWIDENDAVWDKLQIWCRDENGRSVLYRLADKGVGAICLQNVSTDFTMKGGMGQTTGAVRASGIFLYENGNVGTVQHVDLAKPVLSGDPGQV